MLTETAKCRRTLVAGVNRGTTQVTPAGGGVVIKTTPGPYARMLEVAAYERAIEDAAWRIRNAFPRGHPVRELPDYDLELIASVALQPRDRNSVE